VRQAFRTVSLTALAISACLGLAGPARAATDCDNATNQQAMNECAADAYKREDARLNKLYKDVLALSDKTDVARLKQAQVAWIKFRDLHCNYEEGRYEGGTMAPLVGFTCLRDLTRQRNETLQALLKDFH
jgi:uncharacterized protein YecT (DUF1311 family)